MPAGTSLSREWAEGERPAAASMASLLLIDCADADGGVRATSVTYTHLKIMLWSSLVIDFALKVQQRTTLLSPTTCL